MKNIVKNIILYIGIKRPKVSTILAFSYTYLIDLHITQKNILLLQLEL